MQRISILGILLLGLGGGFIARELLSLPTISAKPQTTTDSGPFAGQSAANTVQPGNLLPGNQLAGANALPNAGLLPDGQLLPEERVSIGVYEKCNRSVVHISTQSFAMESFQQIAVREGSGSGSVIDRNGLILTNQHVIDGAKEISVRLAGGASYPAELVGQDPDTDIAVLKIDAPADQLEPLRWGDSRLLRVGQKIFAIGNPFGLERTMSTGMISSLNRQIPSRNRSMRSLIQVDAALNQGNSGGPLLSTSGLLLGMNTAIMSSNGDSAGVGFAIPVSTLQRIVPQLIQNGRVLRPTIGITRVYENESGLLVVSLAKDGPADRAGLRGFSLVTKTLRRGPYRYEQSSVDPSTADLIQSVDGRPVRTADELLDAIETKQPGDSVQLGIIREGQSLLVPLVLGQSQ